jgi:hypothetical protein
LDRALANPDPATRCKQLADLVRADRALARSSALRHLEDGGTSAAAALIDLLADDAILDQHYAILNALLKTGQRDLDLGHALQEETRYWTWSCNASKPGWWFRADDALHYDRAFAILRDIRELHLTKNLPQAREFAQVWKKCPPMDQTDAWKVSQLSEECDLVLSAASRPRDP